MLNVNDPYLAYCLDNAVATFGRSLEAELEKVEGKNGKEIEKKRQRVLDRWLDRPLRYRAPPGAPKVDASAEQKEETVSFTGIDN